MFLYKRALSDREARIIRLEEAAADVRQSLPLWPWPWIGLLYSGQAVTTPDAVYALDRRTAEKAV